MVIKVRASLMNKKRWIKRVKVVPGREINGGNRFLLKVLGSP